jgi:hypothetical protein
MEAMEGSNGSRLAQDRRTMIMFSSLVYLDGYQIGHRRSSSPCMLRVYISMLTVQPMAACEREPTLKIGACT